MALSKKDLKEKFSLQREEVDVPEWGGAVVVRELSQAEKVQFQGLALAGQQYDLSTGGSGTDVRIDMARALEFAPRVAAWGLVEPAMSYEELSALAGRAGDGIERVAHAVYRLSGMVVGDEAKNA